MKKILPLVIVVILVILVFVPDLIGAAQNGKGTGLFPVDLFLFTILPFIILAFLLHFMFKLPSDLPANKAKPIKNSIKAEEAAKTAKAEKAKAKAAKAAKAAEKEKAAKKAAAKAAKAKAAAKAAKAPKKEKPARAEKAPKPSKVPSKAEKATAVAAANDLPDEEIKLEDLSATEPAIAAEPEVTCPECGGKVTMFDPVCPHCGVKFESEEEGPAIIKEQLSTEQPIPEEILPAEEPVAVESLSFEIPEEPKAEITSDFGLKCPTCGGKVGLEEKFCPHCGADFEPKTFVEPEIEKTEAELDAMFGIAPEEVKVEVKPEEKPVAESPGEITLSYEEPIEELPAPKKKGKKKK